MPVESDEQAFRAAIASDPFDDAHRLAYSDWLEERGRDAEAMEQRRRTLPEVKAAWRWFEELSHAHHEGYEDNNCIPVETFIQAGRDFMASPIDPQWGRDYWFTQQGHESLRDEMRGLALQIFWKNWELVTGCPGPGEEERTQSFFSCSC